MEEPTAIEYIEAGHVLRIEGANAEGRWAGLTRRFAGDGGYTTQLRALREVTEQFWDADRRVTV